MNSEGHSWQNRGKEEEEEKSAWIINRMKEAWEKLLDQTLPRAPRPGNEKLIPAKSRNHNFIILIEYPIIIITQFDLIGFLLDFIRFKLKTWFGFPLVNFGYIEFT